MCRTSSLLMAVVSLQARESIPPRRLAPWRFAALTASGGGAMNGRECGPCEPFRSSCSSWPFVPPSLRRTGILLTSRARTSSAGSATSKGQCSPRRTANGRPMCAPKPTCASPATRKVCFNTTSLFVKASGAATFESVYVKRPEPHLQGNGLKLIAWSHKGHVLAAELTCWQYASDFGGVSQFLYDADGERAWEITSQAPPSIRQSLPCRPTPARPGKGTERCEQCSSREADRSLER